MATAAARSRAETPARRAAHIASSKALLGVEQLVMGAHRLGERGPRIGIGAEDAGSLSNCPRLGRYACRRMSFTLYRPFSRLARSASEASAGARGVFGRSGAESRPHEPL